MILLLRVALPILVWLTTCAPAFAQDLIGTCIRVSDGDTIVVKVPGQAKPEKIRVLGVDCPEISHGKNDPGQEPWGTRATVFTKALVLNKEVRIETDVQPRDQYGRLLGYVWVGKTMLNLELMKAGHAMLLTYAPNVKYVDQFVAAQRAARQAGLGLWSPQDELTETPHTYRHNGHIKGNGHIDDDAAQDEQRKPGRHPQAPRGQHHTGQATHGAASVSTASTASAAPTGTSPTVLLNAKSRKYHEPGCRYATGANIKEVPRAEGVAGGEPCRACHPQ
jgi:endonuclease YncB( thermonuclease family)